MTRQMLDKLISEMFSAKAEYPWSSAPSFAVYRHENNKKWFAVIMDIPRSRIGLSGEGNISVVNLKVEPMLTGALCENDGIYPAYHMNKNHWITAEITDRTDKERLLWLVEMSYDLTKTVVKNKN